MSDIHIQRLQHRAHIRGAPAERLRIDRAMAEMLDGGLESALLHAGVDTDEDICIKRFVTRSQLNLSRSDLQLSADWSNAWVDALRAALHGVGDNVIRYRSRLHVLADVATRILRGDHSRAWAWRQLGVWSGTDPGSADALIELAQVLVRHPSAVIPVCQVLAGERVLGAWIARLPGTALRALSQAALRAVAADVAAMAACADVPDAALAAPSPQAIAVPPPQPDAPAAAHAPHSKIAGILAASPLKAELAPIATAGNGLDLAVLVVLAAEPTALCAGDVRQLLIDAGRALLCARGNEAVDAQGASAAPQRRVGESIAARRSRPARIPELATARAADAATARPLSQARAMPAGVVAHATPEAAEHNVEPRADESPPLQTQRSSRQHAHTEFGGLMYLLWLIEPSGVLDTAGGDPLAQRGLRWVLRQIALQLVPLAANDPVLNAFTGSLPDSTDARACEPPTPAEAVDIAVLASRMVELLRERMPEPALAREPLLDTVCRRHADIHFEPGWIELHFRLDSASTAIRRSGLDRDPGWVPWLGTVVKLVYV